MKKLILSSLLGLCIFGITFAFAADIQKSAPSKAGRINKDASKIANAVLPKVVYPTMTHHLGYDGNKFSITVRFNTDMDRSTVIAGGTVRFDFPKTANAPGQITWISDREFKWVQLSNSRFNICIYDPDCEFKLTLTDGIRSKEGLKLDGDNDNKQGGNFTIWFIDIG